MARLTRTWNRRWRTSLPSLPNAPLTCLRLDQIKPLSTVRRIRGGRGILSTRLNSPFPIAKFLVDRIGRVSFPGCADLSTQLAGAL